LGGVPGHGHRAGGDRSGRGPGRLRRAGGGLRGAAGRGGLGVDQVGPRAAARAPRGRGGPCGVARCRRVRGDVTMLQHLPLLFALAGLVLYTVLAGADFGAGIWQLGAFGGTARQIREHAHHANAPVWEANHVWLVFVLVMLWTGYPIFISSVASTEFIPLGLALVGIIVRGLGYTLQNT